MFRGACEQVYKHAMRSFFEHHLLLAPSRLHMQDRASPHDEDNSFFQEKLKRRVEGVDGLFQQVTPICRYQRLSPQIRRYCSILEDLDRRRRAGSSPCPDRLLC